MYTPAMFKPDRAASLAFAEARGFGTICAWERGKPVASAVPFLLGYADDGTPQAAFHVARNNPLTKLADGKSHWLMAVTGADAYVSADWYVSPDQVPTWLYQAVHLTGTVRTVPDHELGPHLDLLSAKFEDRLGPKPPWTSAKMTAGRLETLKHAIVGLVLSVDGVEGSFKLNQHKSDIDYLAVATMLVRQKDAGARALAEEMRSLRPLLFVAETTQPDAPLRAEGKI